MEINNNLIEKWEPKIHRMTQNLFIVGMDKEDIQQELRIAIMKAAKSFDDSKGVIFHTYLHTSMVNTIRTLMTKAEKRLDQRSLDVTYENNSVIPSELINALRDPKNYESEVEVNDVLESKNLTHSEKSFIELRMEGMTMEEISVDLGESAYKVRAGLREKFTEIGTDEGIT